MTKSIANTSLFITGASGFLGQSLLRRLARGPECAVTGLSRRPALIAAGVPPQPGWKYLSGDLTNPASYQTALADAHTIVHLAAATGKERPEVFTRVNVEGTRVLVEQAARAGTSRIVYVSSIAAKFPDRRHYAYAESKLAAERVVQASGLAWVIVRPTLVFGPESPVLRGLIKLVKGPIGIVFGSGEVQVQPISVDDVAEILVETSSQTSWDGETIEAGGPNRLSFGDLLDRIRQRVRGRSGGLLHLPLGPLRALLAALEPALLPVLPFSAGQLAAFANASTADRHPLVDTLRPHMTTIDGMLDVIQRPT
jgi:NADH dehydrogenase